MIYVIYGFFFVVTILISMINRCKKSRLILFSNSFQERKLGVFDIIKIYEVILVLSLVFQLFLNWFFEFVFFVFSYFFKNFFFCLSWFGEVLLFEFK